MEEKKQYKKQLWNDYLKASDFPSEVKNIAREIGELYFEDVKFLYDVRKCVVSGGGTLADKKTGVLYETEEEYHILKHNDKELALRQADMSRLLANIIDIFEDVLPLGTVVDLKKDFLGQKMDLSKVDKIRVVISKRFLGGETGCYYPYAAVLYPIGMAGQNKYIYFSSALIDDVVHMGYSDSIEEMFVYQMKDQLIVKGNRKSMGFANEEEMRAMEKLLTGEEK